MGYLKTLKCNNDKMRGNTMNNYRKATEIKRNTVFKVKNTKVIMNRNLQVSENSKGYFILNFWDQCSYPDITVFPVEYVECIRDEDEYELFKTNIIYGGIGDICLI